MTVRPSNQSPDSPLDSAIDQAFGDNSSDNESKSNSEQPSPPLFAQTTNSFASAHALMNDARQNSLFGNPQPSQPGQLSFNLASVHAVINQRREFDQQFNDSPVIQTIFTTLNRLERVFESFSETALKQIAFLIFENKTPTYWQQNLRQFCQVIEVIGHNLDILDGQLSANIFNQLKFKTLGAINSGSVEQLTDLQATLDSLVRQKQIQDNAVELGSHLLESRRLTREHHLLAEESQQRLTDQLASLGERRFTQIINPLRVLGHLNDAEAAGSNQDIVDSSNSEDDGSVIEENTATTNFDALLESQRASHGLVLSVLIDSYKIALNQADAASIQQALLALASYRYSDLLPTELGPQIDEALGRLAEQNKIVSEIVHGDLFEASHVIRRDLSRLSDRVDLSDLEISGRSLSFISQLSNFAEYSSEIRGQNLTVQELLQSYYQKNGFSELPGFVVHELETANSTNQSTFLIPYYIADSIDTTHWNNPDNWLWVGLKDCTSFSELMDNHETATHLVTSPVSTATNLANRLATSFNREIAIDREAITEYQDLSLWYNLILTRPLPEASNLPEFARNHHLNLANNSLSDVLGHLSAGYVKVQEFFNTARPFLNSLYMNEGEARYLRALANDIKEHGYFELLELFVSEGWLEVLSFSFAALNDHSENAQAIVSPWFNDIKPLYQLIKQFSAFAADEESSQKINKAFDQILGTPSANLGIRIRQILNNELGGINWDVFTVQGVTLGLNILVTIIATASLMGAMGGIFGLVSPRLLSHVLRVGLSTNIGRRLLQRAGLRALSTLSASRASGIGVSTFLGRAAQTGMISLNNAITTTALSPQVNYTMGQLFEMDGRSPLVEWLNGNIDTETAVREHLTLFKRVFVGTAGVVGLGMGLGIYANRYQHSSYSVLRAPSQLLLSVDDLFSAAQVALPRFLERFRWLRSAPGMVGEFTQEIKQEFANFLSRLFLGGSAAGHFLEGMTSGVLGRSRRSASNPSTNQTTPTAQPQTETTNTSIVSTTNPIIEVRTLPAAEAPSTTEQIQDEGISLRRRLGENSDRLDLARHSPRAPVVEGRFDLSSLLVHANPNKSSSELSVEVVTNLHDLPANPFTNIQEVRTLEASDAYQEYISIVSSASSAIVVNDQMPEREQRRLANNQTFTHTGMALSMEAEEISDIGEEASSEVIDESTPYAPATDISELAEFAVTEAQLQPAAALILNDGQIANIGVIPSTEDIYRYLIHLEGRPGATVSFFARRIVRDDAGNFVEDPDGLMQLALSRNSDGSFKVSLSANILAHEESIILDRLENNLALGTQAYQRHRQIDRAILEQPDLVFDQAAVKFFTLCPDRYLEILFEEFNRLTADGDFSIETINNFLNNLNSHPELSPIAELWQECFGNSAFHDFHGLSIFTLHILKIVFFTQTASNQKYEEVYFRFARELNQKISGNVNNIYTVAELTNQSCEIISYYLLSTDENKIEKGFELLKLAGPDLCAQMLFGAPALTGLSLVFVRLIQRNQSLTERIIEFIAQTIENCNERERRVFLFNKNIVITLFLSQLSCFLPVTTLPLQTARSIFKIIFPCINSSNDITSPKNIIYEQPYFCRWLLQLCDLTFQNNEWNFSEMSGLECEFVIWLSDQHKDENLAGITPNISSYLVENLNELSPEEFEDINSFCHKLGFYKNIFNHLNDTQRHTVVLNFETAVNYIVSQSNKHDVEYFYSFISDIFEFYNLNKGQNLFSEKTQNNLVTLGQHFLNNCFSNDKMRGHAIDNNEYKSVLRVSLFLFCSEKNFQIEGFESNTHFLNQIFSVGLLKTRSPDTKAEFVAFFEQILFFHENRGNSFQDSKEFYIQLCKYFLVTNQKARECEATLGTTGILGSFFSEINNQGAAITNATELIHYINNLRRELFSQYFITEIENDSEIPTVYAQSVSARIYNVREGLYQFEDESSIARMTPRLPDSQSKYQAGVNAIARVIFDPKLFVEILSTIETDLQQLQLEKQHLTPRQVFDEYIAEAFGHEGISTQITPAELTREQFYGALANRVLPNETRLRLNIHGNAHLFQLLVFCKYFETLRAFSDDRDDLLTVGELLSFLGENSDNASTVDIENEFKNILWPQQSIWTYLLDLTTNNSIGFQAPNSFASMNLLSLFPLLQKAYSESFYDAHPGLLHDTLNQARTEHARRQRQDSPHQIRRQELFDILQQHPDLNLNTGAMRFFTRCPAENLDTLFASFAEFLNGGEKTFAEVEDFFTSLFGEDSELSAIARLWQDGVNESQPDLEKPTQILFFLHVLTVSLIVQPQLRDRYENLFLILLQNTPESHFRSLAFDNYCTQLLRVYIHSSNPSLQERALRVMEGFYAQSNEKLFEFFAGLNALVGPLTDLVSLVITRPDLHLRTLTLIRNIFIEIANRGVTDTNFQEWELPNFQTTLVLIAEVTNPSEMEPATVQIAFDLIKRLVFFTNPNNSSNRDLLRSPASYSYLSDPGFCHWLIEITDLAIENDETFRDNFQRVAPFLMVALEKSGQNPITIPTNLNLFLETNITESLLLIREDPRLTRRFFRQRQASAIFLSIQYYTNFYLNNGIILDSVDHNLLNNFCLSICENEPLLDFALTVNPKYIAAILEYLFVANRENRAIISRLVPVAKDIIDQHRFSTSTQREGYERDVFQLLNLSRTILASFPQEDIDPEYDFSDWLAEASFNPHHLHVRNRYLLRWQLIEKAYQAADQTEKQTFENREASWKYLIASCNDLESLFELSKDQTSLFYLFSQGNFNNLTELQDYAAKLRSQLFREHAAIYSRLTERAISSLNIETRTHLIGPPVENREDFLPNLTSPVFAEYNDELRAIINLMIDPGLFAENLAEVEMRFLQSRGETSGHYPNEAFDLFLIQQLEDAGITVERIAHSLSSEEFHALLSSGTIPFEIQFHHHYHQTRSHLLQWVVTAHFLRKEFPGSEPTLARDLLSLISSQRFEMATFPDPGIRVSFLARSSNLWAFAYDGLALRRQESGQASHFLGFTSPSSFTGLPFNRMTPGSRPFQSPLLFFPSLSNVFGAPLSNNEISWHDSLLEIRRERAERLRTVGPSLF